MKITAASTGCAPRGAVERSGLRIARRDGIRTVRVERAVHADGAVDVDIHRRVALAVDENVSFDREGIFASCG